jgi:hypothetical protein
MSIFYIAFAKGHCKKATLSTGQGRTSFSLTPPLWLKASLPPANSRLIFQAVMLDVLWVHLGWIHLGWIHLGWIRASFQALS